MVRFCFRLWPLFLNLFGTAVTGLSPQRDETAALLTSDHLPPPAVWSMNFIIAAPQQYNTKVLRNICRMYVYQYTAAAATVLCTITGDRNK